MALESTIENHFCKRVLETGGNTRKLSFIGWRGAPDRACWWPGTDWGIILVELKRPKGGELSAHQIELRAELLNSGQQVHLLWTIAMVDEFIRNRGGHTT